MCFGRLFHVIWNVVPDDMEHCSYLFGTGLHLIFFKAGT